MSGQMKTMLDRSNPLFPADYAFRDIYLLATAAADEESAMDGAIKGLTGWIDCFAKTSLKGVVRSIGVTDVGGYCRKTGSPGSLCIRNGTLICKATPLAPSSPPPEPGILKNPLPSGQTSQAKGNTMGTITIQVGNKNFRATLYDNDSTRALTGYVEDANRLAAALGSGGVQVTFSAPSMPDLVDIFCIDKQRLS